MTAAYLEVHERKAAVRRADGKQAGGNVEELDDAAGALGVTNFQLVGGGRSEEAAGAVGDYNDLLAGLDQGLDDSTDPVNVVLHVRVVGRGCAGGLEARRVDIGDAVLGQ